MKKIFFVILVQIAYHIANAQVYHPLPDSNAIWSEYHKADQYSGRPSFYYRNILGNNDTIILSQTYHKLFKSPIDTVFVNDTSMHYIGGIRQDNKKVYYLPKDSLNEYLLYDFSLQIGDTFLNTYAWYSHFFFFNPIEKLLLYNVDSIKIADGSFRKTFYFAYIISGDTGSLSPECWIEGIGCNMGLLCPIAGLPINSEWNSIVCFKDNDQIRYHNDYFTECFPYNTGIEENNKIVEMTISPNPLREICQIKWNDDNYTVLQIFDAYGKLIISVSIKETTNFIFKKENINAGLYLIKLYHPNGKYLIQKIIIL